eukprot:2414-Rhodomonas_salina.1
MHVLRSPHPPGTERALLSEPSSYTCTVRCPVLRRRPGAGADLQRGRARVPCVGRSRVQLPGPCVACVVCGRARILHKTLLSMGVCCCC